MRNETLQKRHLLECLVHDGYFFASIAADNNSVPVFKYDFAESDYLNQLGYKDYFANVEDLAVACIEVQESNPRFHNLRISSHQNKLIFTIETP